MASRDRSGVEDRPSGRLTDHVGLGLLSARFGRDLLEEGVNDTGVREKRKRLLPAHVMIRYVVAVNGHRERLWRRFREALLWCRWPMSQRS